MTLGTIIWVIVVCLISLGITGLIGYNIRSFVRKWKANPGNWFDLLVGIVIFSIGAVAIWWIVIKYIISVLPT